MSPQIALVGCFTFILFIFAVHSRCKSDVSSAIWIPSIWMALIGSRPIPLWLNPRGHGLSFAEGSPLDMAAYSLLIAVAFVILLRRRIFWSELIRRNTVLFILLFYVALSILWTDNPFISFKRYIKFIGMLLMALIVLTERNPVESIKITTKRCAYLLIPLSILFIKYYPDLGVGYDQWFGTKMVIGVAGNKNTLGQLCLVVGLVFLWALFPGIRKQDTRPYKIQFLIDCFIFVLALHMLILSDSKTSLMSFLVGAGLFLGQGLSFVKRRVGVYLVVIGIVLALLEWSIGFYESFLNLLGRDPTLTNRTEIWQELLPLVPNIWFGTGYDSFWGGERLSIISEARNISEAHNGLLEIYLNLGLIGVSLYVLVIVATYRNCIGLQRSNFNYGRFTYSLLIAILIYNITEAGFKGLALVSFMFYLIAVNAQRISLFTKDVPRFQAESAFARFQKSSSKRLLIKPV